MSYHLGILLRPSNEKNKLYKSIPINHETTTHPTEHYIIPYTGNNVKIMSILHGSFYYRTWMDGDNELQEYKILEGDLNPNKKKTTSSGENEEQKEKEEQEKNVSQKELNKKKSFLSKLFQGEDDIGSAPKKHISHDAPAAAKLPLISQFNNCTLNFKIEVKPTKAGQKILNEYKLEKSNEDLVLRLSSCRPESVDITFTISEREIENSKTLRLHITPNTKVEAYCLDFGSDAIQVSQASTGRRINLFKAFDNLARGSFSNLFKRISQNARIYAKENFFEKKNIYQNNEEVGLYNNLVFVSQDILGAYDLDARLEDERKRKPQVNDKVQFFTSKGLTPNLTENRDAKLSGERKKARVQEAKSFLEEDEVKIFEDKLRNTFLNTAKSLQKNLKLTFLEGIVDHDYIPIYTTCVAKIAWILLEDMRRVKKEFMNFTILYPNSFDAQILNKMKDILRETFGDLLENNPDTILRGYELQFLSESDAAFLGIIARKENIDAISTSKPYAILIDIGKGTVDLSLIKKEGTQYYTIARKGSLKAGNYLTSHIFLDLLCYGYRDFKSLEKEEYIKAHLSSFHFEEMGKVEMDILEYLEKLKTRKSERKVNTSGLVITEANKRGGANSDLVRFMGDLYSKGYSFDSRGSFYKDALNATATSIRNDLQAMFSDLNITSDSISVCFLSGRSFKDINLKNRMTNELISINLPEEGIRVYDKKVHAVSIFNNQKGNLNFCNSVYKNVVFTPPGKGIQLASLSDLISGGVECPKRLICLDNVLQFEEDEKLHLIGQDYYASSQEDMIERPELDVNPVDLCYAGFPFWTSDADQYQINFNLCSYPASETIKKESTKDTPIESVPRPTLEKMREEGLLRQKKMEERFLNED